MTDATTALQRSWRRAWRAVVAEAPQQDEALLQRLLAAYREPQRRYHTLQHLAECIARFEPVQDLAASPAEVELALWFHDAVYDVRGHGNEARSAAWARDELRAARAPAAVAARVHDLVMATRHDALPRPGDAMLVVDIDLSILGASPGRFDEYEAQIRAEYAWVDEATFRGKRRSILTAFLARPTIFGTPHFRAALEAAARANLQRSLDHLED
ncbi:MAG: N-methyl-D-aspartate receptor NMDAR2C subunit [Burkholderiales bacterium]|nr:N-methyl-D-aspartate receptor NMDAR2C subunit [Burkholderiales bacterium]